MGCRVDGIDLTQEYCDVATVLARRLGLQDRVSYRQANALRMPFGDATFSGALTQHISMNIPDKRAFFTEIRRVLRPGGTFALYDPLAGDDEALALPVPWARTASMSHLLKTEETEALLEACGLGVETVRDVSRAALDWFAANAARGAGSPLGLHLLLGEDWPAMARNMVGNLQAGRLRAVQIVARAR